MPVLSVGDVLQILDIGHALAPQRSDVAIVLRKIEDPRMGSEALAPTPSGEAGGSEEELEVQLRHLRYCGGKYSSAIGQSA
ncbi:hypothetical protein Dshi_0415 [Dinoroseobacter shibae DFL 12 = DSM 16493]|uniref:Uncharacterized protein n=1 Tax=Dinoroseobacter shibae (strain DSM 16493 / NCIMB 14021 / DFL 12) TaxID=398580 RepID=A8LN20_DINSH|nr:hypothetical protein Dshi_0415 [Dinoroseobacter shibae DFL 12 = DSM 16493]